MGVDAGVRMLVAGASPLAVELELMRLRRLRSYLASAIAVLERLSADLAALPAPARRVTRRA